MHTVYTLCISYKLKILKKDSSHLKKKLFAKHIDIIYDLLREHIYILINSIYYTHFYTKMLSMYIRGNLPQYH